MPASVGGFGRPIEGVYPSGHRTPPGDRRGQGTCSNRSATTVIVADWPSGSVPFRCKRTHFGAGPGWPGFRHADPKSQFGVVVGAQRRPGTARRVLADFFLIFILAGV